LEKPRVFDPRGQTRAAFPGTSGTKIVDLFPQPKPSEMDIFNEEDRCPF